MIENTNELKLFKSNFKEKNNILEAIQNRTLFYGRVAGTLTVHYFKNVPYSRISILKQLLHIWDIKFTSVNENSNLSKYTLLFDCNSILTLMEGIEFIREVSKNRKVDIEKISIDLNWINNTISITDINTDAYERFIREEINKLNFRNGKNFKFFSGSANVRYLIKYNENKPSKLRLDYYNSIYELLSELEIERRNAKIDSINVELNDLDDLEIKSIKFLV